MKLTINLDKKRVKYTFPFRLNAASFNEDLAALNNASLKIDELGLENKQVERGEKLTATRTATDNEMKMTKNYFIYQLYTGANTQIRVKTKQIEDWEIKKLKFIGLDEFDLIEAKIRQLHKEIQKNQDTLDNLESSTKLDTVSIGFDLEDVILKAEEMQAFYDSYMKNKESR